MLRAQQTVPYEFAIPEFTRTLSLGVYDQSGKLVRRLVECAPLESFEIGLNGLIGKWDGKNDGGKLVAPGVYQIRGYAIGDVQAEGAAYHFNDWAAELGEAALVSKVLAISASPHGGICVLAEVGAERLLFYYQNGMGILWKVWLPESFGKSSNSPAGEELRAQLEAFQKPLLAADDAAVAVTEGGEIAVYGIFNGNEWARGKLTEPAEALAFWRGELVVAQRSGLTSISPAKLEEKRMEGPKAEFRALSGLSTDLLGADTSGDVWKFDGLKWQQLGMAGKPRVTSLTSSGEMAFWAVADADKVAPFVGEFSLAGEFLKNLQMPDGNFSPVAVSHAPPNREILVLRVSETGQQLLGIQPAQDSGGLAGWEIFCDKTIQNSSNFGVADGELVAETSQVSESHFTLKMLDPMTKRPKMVQLELVKNADGVSLQSPDGLTLESVVEGKAIQRIAVKGGKPGSLLLFVGHEGFVEEFNLKGLNQIGLLEVGEIEWSEK